MTNKQWHWPAIAALALLMFVSHAAVAGRAEIETLVVGNPGNSGEWAGASYGGSGPNRICGAVDYIFGIGKYEVTTAQYVSFLNAVAATDTYGLYNPSMWTSSFACGIQQSGSAGSYSYSVATEWADRPVNFVSWGDSARFCNWLHNGQPTGSQNLSTTEDGAYYLDGALTPDSLMAVVREADWRWAIPTEDEWHKAAYHKNDGVTGNYWNYPTGTDVAPSRELIDPDPGNNATYYNNGYTVGSPYYRSQVGAHENSRSPYGTFDQGGNIWEWNEAVIDSHRVARGGGFLSPSYALLGATRNHSGPASEGANFGFRVVCVPEPTSLALLAIGGMAILARRRR